MKRIGLFLLFAAAGWGQIVYTVSKTTATSSSTEVITVQQPSSSAKTVNFVSAYIDCSAACTITVERNGTAATATSLTPNPGNPDQAAASALAFSGSDVGTGTVVTRMSLAAGDSRIVDLTRIYMNGTGTSKNLTVRTGSFTGTVNIVITFTER